MAKTTRFYLIALDTPDTHCVVFDHMHRWYVEP